MKEIIDLLKAPTGGNCQYTDDKYTWSKKFGQIATKANYWVTTNALANGWKKVAGSFSKDNAGNTIVDGSVYESPDKKYILKVLSIKLPDSKSTYRSIEIIRKVEYVPDPNFKGTTTYRKTQE